MVKLVRLAKVMLYNGIRRLAARFGAPGGPTVAQDIVVSWSGMRGLVTLATALALPEAFPSRDLIVLSAPSPSSTARRGGHIDDDVFHELQQELDWEELANSPRDRLDLMEG